MLRSQSGKVAHSSAFHDLEMSRGKNVTVVGAGASGLDLAALLHEGGAYVSRLSRNPELNFHGAPGTKPRSIWSQMLHPSSGMGPGLRSRFLCRRTTAVPSAAAELAHEDSEDASQARSRLADERTNACKVPILLGYSIRRAEAKDGRLYLDLVGKDGSHKEHSTELVIAATGYKVDVRHLTFLSAELHSQIRSAEHSPVLSPDFQSSVLELYFVGLAAPIASALYSVLRLARTLPRAKSPSS